jgi:hypothetical protein
MGAALMSLTSSGDVMRFSTASTTPSFVRTPIAVEPSCSHHIQNTPHRVSVPWGSFYIQTHSWGSQPTHAPHALLPAHTAQAMPTDRLACTSFSKLVMCMCLLSCLCAHLDSLYSILHLEQAPLWTEGVLYRDGQATQVSCQGSRGHP